jgi:hypothetical protein
MCFHPPQSDTHETASTVYFYQQFFLQVTSLHSSQKFTKFTSLHSSQKFTQFSSLQVTSLQAFEIIFGKTTTEGSQTVFLLNIFMCDCNLGKEE